MIDAEALYISTVLLTMLLVVVGARPRLKKARDWQWQLALSITGSFRTKRIDEFEAAADQRKNVLDEAVVKLDEWHRGTRQSAWAGYIKTQALGKDDSAKAEAVAKVSRESLTFAPDFCDGNSPEKSTTLIFSQKSGVLR